MENGNQPEELKVKVHTILECAPEDMECQRNVLEQLKGLQGALEDERATDPALGELLLTVRDTITHVETNIEACGGPGEEVPSEAPAEALEDQ